MIEWLRSFFGTYTPPTYTMTEVVGETVNVTNVIPAGAAGVDWQYIAGVVLFAIVVYCFLKILGGLLCKIF